VDSADYDVVVIGAGVSGLHQLYRLDRLGLQVKVFEAAADVGGTWYWNRYPGARFDSESYTYAYSFSEDLLQEWDWSERYASQPETERYLQYVADKFDLRRYIEFNARVTAAVFDESSAIGTIDVAEREPVRARFLITAVGVLSAPQMPSNLEGLGEFEGQWFHTGMWPHEPVPLEGKRVAVVGTGASGIQVITEVAKVAAQLTVFQRTAIYAAPLRNSALTAEQQKEIRRTYHDILARCNSNTGGFEFAFDTQRGLDASKEERMARYEQLWALPGFAKWMAGYPDIGLSEELNKEYSDFVRGKIRERIADPALAEKLVPDFPFGTRRIPLESGYFEVYQQDNVELVSLQESPIERYTPHGILSGGVEREFDIIIFATGFDAFTGAFNKIDIQGVGGQRLSDKWADGPRTNLGMLSMGFPNLFMLLGPHSKVFCNMPRCSEQNVEWVTDCIAYLLRSGYQRIEPTAGGEKQWTDHVYETYAPTLVAKYETDSFWLGTNTPGKKKTIYGYMGPFPQYRAKCDEVAANGYEGFSLS
jgi:cation diffusion facilitator CzcD-associated flavoprotein CzcO